MYKMIQGCNRNYYIKERKGNSYSSEVYKLISNDKTYILKIPYDKRAYDTELLVLKELNKKNFCAPKLIEEVEIMDKQGYIMSYLQGSNGEDIVYTKSKIKQLVKMMNEFKRITIDNNSLLNYDYTYIVNTFNENTEAIASYVGNDIYKYLKKEKETYFSILKTRSYTDFIHRDFRLGNLIISNKDIFFIDFESCAVGDSVMDLMKVYPELKNKDETLGDFFLNEYAYSNNIDKKYLLEVIDCYILLDKINSIVWCIKRNKQENVLFKESIKYINEYYAKRC